MDNYILLLGLLLLFLIYYKSCERFENTNIKNTNIKNTNIKNTKNKECSRLSLNNSIYDYNVNIINRGAR
jgi:hypothetical protein